MYGLVLEGGGAKGAFQIGAWKALKELGVDIKGISGTSVGALNGAIIAQDEFERCYDIWYNMSPSRVINIDEKVLEKLLKFDITPDNLHYILGELKNILNEKGLDITPLRKLLKEFIKEDIIRASKKDFGIVTVSLTELRPLELYIEDIPNGKLIDYLIASAYLPIFKMEKLGGKLYLDGGFYDNLPIRLLVSKGYRDLIAVRLYGIGRTRRVRKRDINITYITPSDDLGMTLDFTTERARKNLKLGYFDTLKTFNKLKGNKYYIEPKNDEDYFINYFMNLEESKVLKLGKILGIEHMPYRRMLFEAIIPRLGELLNIGRDGGYEDIILAIYERIAERYRIEKFRLYNFENFEDEVLSKYRPYRGNVSKMIPRLFKQSDLLMKTVKDDILDEITDVLFNNLVAKESL
ncbi:patatin-like phospholipase family protein [Paramaledivibacter caminithermalis]|jgi:NTE family protein|uniref:NTE family protein n=1 Tax=Paramaledivibacter caminithermalis (strain DSM 15212 / CIP 107654 / DViRD3) TaxID=1121301 RepID=A0A1M6L4D0_PARC5|nr:patatin-like phospholipase family protein [Paramaledivibacter caminithermalis]SHJ66042.1 NTE family protein [Paramaledivibacter caminithermalis DSM 15212]